MGSSNGTFVNDVRTDGQSQLKDGDIIRLGTVLLKFFAHDNVDSVMHDKIYRMATIDAGTQIFNKQYLLDALEAEIKFSRTYGRDLSIIYYDLDHFKPVNDNYGHNAGDYILRESAALVRTAVRKDDILGRFGGEEFVIILPNTDARTATELAERIRQKHESFEFLIEFEKDGTQQRVNHRQTISIGVAQLRPPVATIKEFLEIADKKLYTSKQTGRNRVTT
jgi:diguanylate cyclase (GGDEF)-like protein